MARSVEEWRGKTEDDPIPARVKLRIFDRYHGHCHISGRKIRPGDAWHCDHVIPLIQGGLHAESNLAPALIDPHKAKTKAEVAEKSRVAKRRKSHLGLKKKRTITRWRKFDGTIVTKPRER
jgi:hypothetical protein